MSPVKLPASASLADALFLAFQQSREAEGDARYVVADQFDRDGGADTHFTIHSPASIKFGMVVRATVYFGDY